nr:MAG TPA: hypothetical protein [Caudoviricetes sp.]
MIVITNLTLKSLQRQGKGRTQSSFQRLSNSCDIIICGNRQRAPCNGRASTSSRQGWDKFRVNWGSNPQPSTIVNEQ